jgi:hypothetical protein
MFVGIEVRCTVCSYMKKPHGRSAPLGLVYCDADCPGYNESPRPGCLWPGETEQDYGYEVCSNAVKKICEPSPEG